MVGKPLEGHGGGVWSVTYSPNGHHIISGSEDKTIHIWDAEMGAIVVHPLEGHIEGVYSVAFSPDGQHILSGSNDRSFKFGML